MVGDMGWLGLAGMIVYRVIDKRWAMAATWATGILRRVVRKGKYSTSAAKAPRRLAPGPTRPRSDLLLGYQAKLIKRSYLGSFFGYARDGVGPDFVVSPDLTAC